MPLNSNKTHYNSLIKINPYLILQKWKSLNPYHFSKSKPKFYKNQNYIFNKELTCCTTKSKPKFHKNQNKKLNKEPKC